MANLPSALLKNVTLPGIVIGFAVLGSAAFAQNYVQRANQARTQLSPAQQQPQLRPTRSPRQPVRASMTGTVMAPAVMGGLAGSVHGAYQTSARPVTASASVGGLRQALTAFYIDNGRMPYASEGLNALITRPAGAKNWRGPYVTVTSGRPPFTDPWGNLYRLIDTSRPGSVSFTIKSNGPDGMPDTSDDLFTNG